MRRIQLDTGDIYATNSADGGLFWRRTNESAYRQLRGTSQTPVFRSRKQFRRYLSQLGVRGRTVYSFGWAEA